MMIFPIETIVIVEIVAYLCGTELFTSLKELDYGRREEESAAV